MKSLQVNVVFALLLACFDSLDAGGSSHVPKPKLPDPANVTLQLVSDYSHWSNFADIGDFLTSMQLIFNNVQATLTQLNIHLHLMGISWLSKQQQDDLFLFSKDGTLINADTAEVTLLQWVQEEKIPNISLPVDIIALLTSVTFTSKYSKGFSRINDTCNEFGNPGLALVRDLDGTYLVDIPLSQHILHLLGSEFDGEGKSANCKSSSGHLMSNEHSQGPYTPSECTKEEVQEALKEKMEKGCFHDFGPERKMVLTSLAGEMKIMKRLCIPYGEKWKHLKGNVEVCKEEIRAKYMDNHPDDQCAVLCCSGGKVSYKKRELNGMQCISKEKFCVNGKCVNRHEWKENNFPEGDIDIQPHKPT